jgi:hypothetical protein
MQRPGVKVTYDTPEDLLAGSDPSIPEDLLAGSDPSIPQDLLAGSDPVMLLRTPAALGWPTHISVTKRQSVSPGIKESP